MNGRRIARLIGRALITIGILGLLWGFVTWRWGDPVTSIYTRWKQHQLAHEYASIAPRFALAPKAAAASTHRVDREKAIRAAADRMRGSIDDGQAIGRIVVPRLGLNMVLVNGTDAGALEKGPGRDPRSYLPGEGQLIYIAGHRTTFLAPFAHIDSLRPGDRVVLKMPYAIATYRVAFHVIVPAADLARLKSHGREVVALQACHPRFSARDRYIVYAWPISIVPVARGTSSTVAAAAGLPGSVGETPSR